jgi:hypothetical protein
MTRLLAACIYTETPAIPGIARVERNWTESGSWAGSIPLMSRWKTHAQQSYLGNIITTIEDRRMKAIGLGLMALLALTCAHAFSAGDKPTRHDPREALRPFNHLIGAWKGTGLPEGSREEKNKGLWIESMEWIWQFKGDKVWLQVTFADGKHFVRGELRHIPDKGVYQLTVQSTAKDKRIFTGKLQDRRLILSRFDDKKNEDQQLIFSFLHPNRFLYTYQVKPHDRSLYTRVYQVGATKKGIAFAAADGRPECVVSGGLGTIKVSFNGKTYYVCCSGCRTEFNADPEKYVKEFEEKQAKKAKEE